VLEAAVEATAVDASAVAMLGALVGSEAASDGALRSHFGAVTRLDNLGGQGVRGRLGVFLAAEGLALRS